MYSGRVPSSSVVLSSSAQVSQTSRATSRWPIRAASMSAVWPSGLRIAASVSFQPPPPPHTTIPRPPHHHRPRQKSAARPPKSWGGRGGLWRPERTDAQPSSVAVNVHCVDAGAALRDKIPDHLARSFNPFYKASIEVCKQLLDSRYAPAPGAQLLSHFETADAQAFESLNDSSTSFRLLITD